MRKVFYPLVLISIFPSLFFSMIYFFAQTSLSNIYKFSTLMAISLITAIIAISNFKISKRDIVLFISIKAFVDISFNAFLVNRNCNVKDFTVIHIAIGNFVVALISLYYFYVKENLQKNPPLKITKMKSVKDALRYRMKWYMRILTILVGILMVCAPFLMIYEIIDEISKNINLASILFVVLLSVISILVSIFFIPVGILGRYPKFMVKFISGHDSALVKKNFSKDI